MLRDLPCGTAAAAVLLATCGGAQAACDQDLTAPGELELGTAVSLDGATLALGAPGQGSGRVLVHTRTPDGWAWSRTLDPPDPDALRFGESLALDADALAVGEPAGPAHVFRRDGGGGWALEATLATGGGVRAVALRGSTLAVGSPDAPAAPGSGEVRVFTRAGGAWSLEAVLLPGVPETEGFGHALSLSSDRLAVGVPDPGVTLRGAVHVFERDGTAWQETAVITSFVSPTDDDFGFAVALAGPDLVVGEPNSDLARVYRLLGTTWLFQQTLLAPGVPQGTGFGESVALAGDEVLVGAPRFEYFGQPPNHGAAFLFRREAEAWSNVDQVVTDFQAGAQAGVGVDLEAGTYVFGAPLRDGAVPDEGLVTVHVPMPAPGTYCTAKTTSEGCAPFVSVSSPQVSMSDPGPVLLTAALVRASASGLLYYGLQGPAALPFLGGTLCVQQPLKRLPPQSSGGFGACGGAFSTDVAAAVQGAGGVPGAFDTLWAQYWFRDPAHPDGTGVGLTDAAVVPICP